MAAVFVPFLANWATAGVVSLTKADFVNPTVIDFDDTPTGFIGVGPAFTEPWLTQGVRIIGFVSNISGDGYVAVNPASENTDAVVIEFSPPVQRVGADTLIVINSTTRLEIFDEQGFSLSSLDRRGPGFLGIDAGAPLIKRARFVDVDSGIGTFPHLDDLYFEPPRMPRFGEVVLGNHAMVGTGFQEPAVGAVKHARDSAAPGQEIGFTATVTGNAAVRDEAGTKQFFVNNGTATLRTELIDLRETTEAVIVGIDVRAWENSSGSDFEQEDFLRVYVEASIDGLSFEQVDIASTTRGGTPDRLKALEVPPGGATTPFTRFQTVIDPERYATLRVVIEAANNSASERFGFDNVSISSNAIVAEPSSGWLAMLATSISCSYALTFRVRRRGQAVRPIEGLSGKARSSGIRATAGLGQQ